MNRKFCNKAPPLQANPLQSALPLSSGLPRRFAHCSHPVFLFLAGIERYQVAGLIRMCDRIIFAHKIQQEALNNTLAQLDSEGATVLAIPPQRRPFQRQIIRQAPQTQKGRVHDEHAPFAL